MKRRIIRRGVWIYSLVALCAAVFLVTTGSPENSHSAAIASLLLVSSVGIIALLRGRGMGYEHIQR